MAQLAFASFASLGMAPKVLGSRLTGKPEVDFLIGANHPVSACSVSGGCNQDVPCSGGAEGFIPLRAIVFIDATWVHIRISDDPAGMPVRVRVRHQRSEYAKYDVAAFGPQQGAIFPSIGSPRDARRRGSLCGNRGGRHDSAILFVLSVASAGAR